MKLAALLLEDTISDQRLTDTAIQTLLAQLNSHWCITATSKPLLTAELTLNNYQAVVSLVNGIVEVAEADDHHPVITFGYNQCRIEYTTHSSGGLSAKDFVCAVKIDHIIHSIT